MSANGAQAERRRAPQAPEFGSFLYAVPEDGVEVDHDCVLAEVELP